MSQRFANLGDEPADVRPAPERDRPSEGCQLAVQHNRNYVTQKRQATTWHQSITRNRNAFPRYVFPRRLSCNVFRATPFLFDFRFLLPPPHLPLPAMWWWE